MTLDEVIKRYKKHSKCIQQTLINKEEALSVYELLKELKKLRETPDKLVPKYRDGIQDEYNRGANEMLEEVIDDIRKYMDEVNADDK